MSLITPSGTEVMSGSSTLGDFCFFGFGGKLPYLRCKSSHSVDSPSARRYDVDAASKGQVLVHRETRMKSNFSSIHQQLQTKEQQYLQILLTSYV